MIAGDLFALALACLVACTDDEPSEPPTCESLGCDNAFCNALGACACDGVACVQCGRTDAGVCVMHEVR
jgi:hypothetical protein